MERIVLKTVISAFLILGSTILSAQDVVVFSQYSDTALKELEKIAQDTFEEELLKLYKVKSVKAIFTALTKHKAATFSVDENLPLVCKAIVEKYLKEFNSKVNTLSKQEKIKQIPTLKVEFVSEEKFCIL